MKIKISKAWSLKVFAYLSLFLATIFAITLIFKFSIPNILFAFILFFLGVALKRKNVFVIFRPYGPTVELTKNTLGLLKLSHGQESDILKLDKIGTVIKITKVGFISIMVFNLVDTNSPKEKYITDTLVKYQR